MTLLMGLGWCCPSLCLQHHLKCRVSHNRTALLALTIVLRPEDVSDRGPKAMSKKIWLRVALFSEMMDLFHSFPNLMEQSCLTSYPDPSSSSNISVASTRYSTVSISSGTFYESAAGCLQPGLDELHISPNSLPAPLIPSFETKNYNSRCQ